jgi:hypothetical protein
MSKVWLVLLLGIFVGASAASAQSVPGNPGNPGDFSRNPHPTMPWAGNNPNQGAFNYGQVIQYIPVSPQRVEIEVPVSLPDGVPAQTQKQVQEIPGYYITETTTGYWYPERWTLQQLNVGVYQWVKLPAEFRRK